MFFVGGPNAAKGNQYFEPGCHLDCLIYAMQVCPFIAGKMEHAPIEKVQAKHPEGVVEMHSGFTTAKSDWWVIQKATGWSYIIAGQTLLISPHHVKMTPPMKAAEMTGEQWNKVYDWLQLGPGAKWPFPITAEQTAEWEKPAEMVKAP
jgi:hypothetical protein